MEENRNVITIDTSTAQEEFERLVTEIDATSNSLSEAKSETTQYQKELEKLNKSIQKNTEKLRNLNALEEQDSATKKKIQTLNSTISRQLEERVSIQSRLDAAQSRTITQTASLKSAQESLVLVLKDLNYAFYNGNLTYEQLSNTLSRLKQTYKTLPAKEASMFASGISSIEKNLAKLDSSMGVYKRNMGNYTEGFSKGMRNVFVQSQQLIRELPSLANSPQQFLMAISNNLPYFIDAFKSLYDEQIRLTDATRTHNTVNAEGVAINNQAAAGAVNRAAAASTYTNAVIGNSQAIDEINRKEAARIALNERLNESLNKVTSSQRVANGYLIETSTLNELLDSGLISSVQKWERLGLIVEKAGDKFLVTENGLRNLHLSRSKLNYDAQKEIDNLNAAYVEAAKNGNTVGKSIETAEKASIAFGTKFKAGLKTISVAIKGLLLNPISAVVITLTLLITNWEKFSNMVTNWGWVQSITEWFTGATKATREWQEALKKSSEAASKTASELEMYYKVASNNKSINDKINALNRQDAAYEKLRKDLEKQLISENQETRAAKKVVEIMKQQGVVLDEVKVKSGEYAEQIDKVTSSLLKQAKMAAAMDYLSNMYKDILDKELELANRESNGVTGLDKITAISANDAISKAGGVPNVTPEDIYKASVESLQKEVDDARKKYEEVATRILEGLQDSNLEISPDGEKKGDGYGSADRWKSYWEEMIKEREEALQESVVAMEGIETNFIKYSDKEWWKYTQQGEEYFNNMIDEYKKHYADLKNRGKIDADTYDAHLKELAAKESKYKKDSALYFDKIMKQYVLPNYENEMKLVEEWYIVERKNYEDLGLWTEKQADLDRELYNRKYELAKKFRDEFENNYVYLDVSLDFDEKNMQIQLNKLEQWFNDEKFEYSKAGKDIENLTIEYNRRKAAINDEYYLKELEKEKRYYERSAELALARKTNELELKKTGSISDNSYIGFAGTNLTGTKELEDLKTDFESNALSFLSIINGLRREEIQLNLDLANGVYETEDERIKARERLAEVEMQIAKETSDYEVQQYQNTAKQAEIKSKMAVAAVQGTFSTLGTLFTNLSELEEEGSEEAKGLAIAGAILNAMGSAVSAYQSAAAIPYVGFILGPIAAAAALAAGAAQVAQMQKVDASGKSNTGISNAYVGATPSELTGALNAMPITTGNNEQVNINSGSIRAYIVDSDVSNGLNNYNKRNSNSSF